MGQGNSARQLGVGSLLALGLNGIIGVGIFFAPGEVAARVPGSLGLAVYGATALALLPIAWTYATLGGRFDRDGGPYVWALEAFGPTSAFAVGWIAYVSALFSTSAVMVGLAQHVAPSFGLHGVWGVRGFVVMVLAALSGVVSIGLKPSAAAWNIVTALKLMPLLLLIVTFLVFAPDAPAVAARPLRFESFQRAMLVVVFALQGFEVVPVPAGHVRNPRLAVPVATVGALAGASLVYVLIHAACVRSLPDLAHAQAPLVETGQALGGATLGSIMELGTNLSAFGIALGMMAMTPRYLAALGSRDGLGAWLAKEDARRVPQRALWITAATVFVFSFWGELGELFALSSVAVLAQYSVTAAALGWLAFRRSSGLRRWHILPVPFAALAIVLVAQGATSRELAVAGGVLAVGLALLGAHRARRLRGA